jgi:hypothetical protein
MSETKKRTQRGEATTDLIMSSHSSDNSALFPEILKLHVPEGSTVADVTFSNGVFWRKVDLKKYKLLTSDIKTGVDCRKLTYENGSIDCVVFDPPYMEGFYRKSAENLAGGGNYSAFRSYYSNGEASTHQELKYHDRVVDMYMTTGIETYRVLREEGIFIVKCQDEVSSNRQKLTHVEIIFGYEKLGYYCKDIFVITRLNKPGVSRLVKQVHARKNHSYFLIFVKEKSGNPRYRNCSEFVSGYSRDID